MILSRNGTLLVNSFVSPFSMFLDPFEDAFTPDLRVCKVYLHLDLYSRVLQIFHGHVIIDLRR